ncbi:MAG: polysaccharide deacetylase [Lachnospiraceae bacterium]|nr:polysaccharide deacetylase [Lachnospiraceae bacterium]
MEKRRRQSFILKSLIAFELLIIILLILVLTIVNVQNGNIGSFFKQTRETLTGLRTPGTPEGGAVVEAVTEQELPASDQEALLARAKRLADQYDYTAAIELLKEAPEYNTATQLQNAAAEYQVLKDSTVAYPLDQITHVFFHTMVRDTSKAFDGDDREAGYNQVMTTIDEFNSIIQQMYDRGYVMVSLHDMCEVNPDGTVTKKEIRLPPGKTPFVLSQDDVSYYHYMVGDGFANKLVLDENGSVKNSYIEDDGSVSIGDYDMVPLIDTFVDEHPDFAYHGHKGIVALTGYEGVLGYRTDEVYRTREESRLTEYQRAFLNANPDFDWEQEVAEAKKVAEAMKADGWEFASHTWGHINPVAYGYDATVKDTTRWLENVATVVGDTDVLIFAFGADINDWTPYTMNNEFFAYLKQQGFSIYCNVDGSQKAWVQFGDDYMRQGRRNLDGYRMYYNPEMCDDLFDVSQAWDDARPTPVPAM